MSLRATIDQAGHFPVVQRMVHQYTTPIDFDAPPAGVLHTTEGGWAGSDAILERHFAPHFMLGMNGKSVEIMQFVPVGVIGAALKAHNNKARVQIEMIGYAKEEPWLPDLQTLDALASLMNVCLKEWGIPLSHPWADGDYGRAGHNAHRSAGKFGHVAGWYGHADCPDPDTHWDPGNLQWSQVFDHAHALDKAATA